MAEERKKRSSKKSTDDVIGSVIDKSGADDILHDPFSGSKIVYGSSAGLTKTAAESGDVSFYPPRWFSPMLSWVHFYMPTDLKTTGIWIRHWDVFHPLVGNAIDLHTQLMLSRLEIKVKDPYVRRVYEEVFDMLGGIQFLYDMVREYWLMGEVFVLLNWDESLGLFTDKVFLPPEDIIVESMPFGIDEEAIVFKLNISLRAFSPEKNQLDKVLQEKLGPELILQLQRNQSVELPRNLLLCFQRKQSPYMLRGTSIVLRAMKDLLYEDKLREAQYAIAQRFVNPKEIWKIGNDQRPATQQMIDRFRELLMAAEQNPLFTLVTNHLVSFEMITNGSSALSPLKSEFDWIEERIMTAMFVNKALTHAEGPTYANSAIALRALMQRYMSVRAALERALIDKIFLPIAVLHDFYRITPVELSSRTRAPLSEREPILPEFEWASSKAMMEGRSIESFAQALKSLGFPMRVIAEVLGFDYERIKKMKEEEEGSVFDPLREEWRKQTNQYVIPSPTEAPPGGGGGGLFGVGASFKLPVISGYNRDGEPIVEEKEFAWTDKQMINNKAKLVRYYIAPYLKNKEPIPLEKIALLGKEGLIPLKRGR